MKLEFDLYKIEDTDLSKYFIKNNEFILVGEQTYDDIEYYLCHSIQDHGIKVIPGITIQEFAFIFPKKRFVKTEKTIALDIPKEYLTLNIIEDIQRLN